MIDAFRRYLSLNGIQYEELNSIINFEYNELKYMFVYDESDTHYFRIILPNIAEVKNDNEISIYKNKCTHIVIHTNRSTLRAYTKK